MRVGLRRLLSAAGKLKLAGSATARWSLRPFRFDTCVQVCLGGGEAKTLLSPSGEEDSRCGVHQTLEILNHQFFPPRPERRQFPLTKVGTLLLSFKFMIPDETPHGQSPLAFFEEIQAWAPVVDRPPNGRQTLRSTLRVGNRSKV